MPSLNWNVFAQLPGGAESNFEMLCRALIRRHYERYGDFAALAAQPGVEFHLRLRTSCTLGEPGWWYGWQCRWYDLPSGRALGTARRIKIEKAIATTQNVLPDLTDFVLWTRHTLTEGDQCWYYGLKTSMRLHLWTSAEVEEHLSGEAEIFRRTYFGELVLTPEILAQLHKMAVAPIRLRWRPEVHQTVEAERRLHRMLGDAGKWDDLQKVAEQLKADFAMVEPDLNSLDGPIAEAASELPELIHSVLTTIGDVVSALDRGDLDILRQELAARFVPPSKRLMALPHQLRAARHRAALTLTNVLADIRRARGILSDVDDCLGIRLIAIVADCGCGKTQLSAQLTASSESRPAGIVLHGGDLHAGDNLDDLASHVVIQGTRVSTMEALVAAVDAAGRRAHRRLPIIIDGLNEAEDARDWKAPIASILELLRLYPYVLVVCTLRTAFVGEALPANTNRLDIVDFGLDTVDAIRRYFQHYRINAMDAELPGFLRHPLTLQIFCEVTNPRREAEVGIEAMPQSLTALFDRYLDQAAERVVQLASRTQRYSEQDVRTSLNEIGEALWEEKVRTLDMAALRRRLNDDTRPWDQSMVRALEHEGVLLRVQADNHSTARFAIVYDALAGHLVADRLLARHGREGVERWLKNPDTTSALTGPVHTQHPLSQDIFAALVGLFPRRLHGRQLWPLLEEPLRTTALIGAAALESSYLDAQTVDELARFATQTAATSRDILYQLHHTRGVPTHPLNADFLDAVLRPIPVADRDFWWTEWVRNNREGTLDDLIHLERRWHNTIQRSPSDGLRARWVMWTLTSTVRQLRDQATRTLYWFGRGNPRALFDLAIDALAINDPYVGERLLAASYGVAMAHQFPDAEFATALRAYLAGLRNALIGPSASHPTSHWLARLYVQGVIDLARAYHQQSVPEGCEAENLSFAPGPTFDPIGTDDPRAEEININMDFEYYTLGRLFEDRHNRNMPRTAHQAAEAHIRGTVWTLGWRKTKLGAIDQGITPHMSRHDRSPIERYAKKYGWIGFYTYAGMLDHNGQLRTDDERLPDVDIDPSFPEPPRPAPFNLPIWARPTPADNRLWVRQGLVDIPNELLRRADVGSCPGPWVAARAYLHTEGQQPGRRVFGILTALLVATADADRLVEVLNDKEHPGELHLPDAPSIYYTFAGEIPWVPDPSCSRGERNPVQPYRDTVQVGDEPVEIEILARRYGWETYHSTLNQANGAFVPSKPFSATLDLRGVPQSFDQLLPNGAHATLSLSASSGFTGHLLYLREDLVHQYSAGRQLIWFFWGERELYPYSYHEPRWLARTRKDYKNVWRYVRKA